MLFGVNVVRPPGKPCPVVGAGMLNEMDEAGRKEGIVLGEVPIWRELVLRLEPKLDRFGAGVSSSESVRSITSGCLFWPLDAVEIDPLAEMVLFGVCTENDL